jgi:hypothetical protein
MQDGSSTAKAADQVALHINPFTVAESGWRGLSISGNRKRKAYTVLHNDKVLVTALLTGIPGEYGLRHSHESGELSIHFDGALKPMVSWNPPGLLHGGIPARPSVANMVAENLASQEALVKSGSAEVASLVQQIMELQAQMQELQRRLDESLRPEPGPRVLIDILFPPFKTTVDDPALPEPKTVVGQWFD